MSSTNDANPSKATGQFHSAKGTVVESIGDVTGSTQWQQSGKQEHAAGEAEFRAAQAKEYAKGGVDRVVGKKDTILGAVTGDKSQEASGNVRQEKGSAQQTANKPT